MYQVFEYIYIYIQNKKGEIRYKIGIDRSIVRKNRWINFSLDITRHFSIHPLFARSNNVRMLTNPRATRESRDVPKGEGEREGRDAWRSIFTRRNLAKHPRQVDRMRFERAW